MGACAGRIVMLLVCVVGLSSMAGCQSVGGPDKAKTVFVSGDGTGDYNCAGTSDQLQINEALAYAAAHPERNTVYLKGPHTYLINDTINIGSATTLTGDKTAVIKLIDHARWPRGKALVRGKGQNLHDITICGFEIDGNDKNNYEAGARQGASYYTMLAFSGITNLDVHHMYLHDNMNDALSVNRSKNIKYHDNVVYRHGHDGIQARHDENVLVYNNKFIDRTNVAIRFADCNHCKAYNNDITAESGGAGIQIQHSSDGTMDDIEIFNNTVYKTNNAGIFVYNARDLPKERACNVWIHNNLIYDCGRANTGYFPGGILVMGFDKTLIENNTIDGCYGAGIVSKRVTSESGVPRKDLAPPQGTSGFTTIVRKNIVSSTKPHNMWQVAAGLWNDDPGHAYVSSNNCYYNNEGGAYAGKSIEKSDDLVGVDPEFVDAEKGNFTLKPLSPCRTAGPDKTEIGYYGKVEPRK